MIVVMDIMSEEIDLLRGRMYGLSTQVNGLSHPRLVRLSQLLDRKLNSYLTLVRYMR